MPEPNPQPANFRFRLRSLILLITVLCIVLGTKVNQVARQRRAIRALFVERAIIAYDFQLNPSIQGPTGPAWLRSWLGEDYFAHVEMVSFLVPMLGGPTSDNITDDLLTELHALPQLKVVILQDCEQVTDAGLRHLAGLTQLRELWLSRTAITDRGLASLSNLQQLTRLDLEETAITDEGLAQLVPLMQLEQLHMSDTAITDDGVEHVCQLKNLKTVDLTLTQVTPAGVARLRAALPNCVVYDP